MRMKIKILWIGRTKERCLAEGINRYLKILNPLARISVIEIKEGKGSDIKKSLSEEGRKILKQTGSYVLLDEKGKEFTSEEFAGFLKDRENIDFVLGGAYGVSNEVRENAGYIIALSRMTFTHEMARLFFIEQLYRAVTILKGMRYHH